MPWPTTSPATTPTCTAASIRSPRRPTPPSKGPAGADRGLHRRRPADDDLHQERDRGDQPRRALLGRAPTSVPGDAVLITQMEHHANIVPWQVLCRERGASLRYLEVDERGELSLAGVSRRSWPAETCGWSPSPTSRTSSERSTRSREMTARGAPGRGGVAHRRRSGGAPDARRRRRMSGPTSTPGRATRRSGRPASACCTAAASARGDGALPHRRGHDRLGRLPERDLERAALEVRSGHPHDRRGGRAGRRRRLPGRARHGPRASARAGPDRATCSTAWPRCPACGSWGRPEAEGRGGLASFTVEGMHPHDIAELLGPRGRLRPRRAPLRPAADALPGSRQRPPGPASASTTSEPDIDALVAALQSGRRDLRAVDDGRPLPRLHPRALQAAAELRRARPARPRGSSSTTRSAATSWASTSGSRTTASRTSASTGTAARSPRPPPRSPRRSSRACPSSRSGRLDADWMIELLGIPVSATRRKCALLNLKVVRGAVTGDNAWPA